MSKPATTSLNVRPPGNLPRLRWQWDFDSALGENEARRLLLLLSALLDTSALRTAAAHAEMSYRAAWGLLRRCDDELGLPLVIMERGRGTRLTPLGESLVEIDGAARLALGEVHSTWEARMHEALTPVLHAAKPVRLHLVASHDLALADWIEHGRRVALDVDWKGSEDALAALGRGECDVAGFHVPETWTEAQLAVWLARWLKPTLHVCTPAMQRQQGLLVARGNPLGLHSLADVANKGARLVNRQRGSGTRGLIDQLLTANGIEASSMDGYAHEEFTHEAVAATVAAGVADAGFAIEAAAARYDLDFVPIVRERYGFAMRKSVATSEAGRALLSRLGGNTFRQRLHAMPGYAALSVNVGQWQNFLK